MLCIEHWRETRDGPIAEEDGIIRHIQLKAAHLEAKASKQKVHIALSAMKALATHRQINAQ